MSVRVVKYYPGRPVPEKEGYKNILIHTSDKNFGGSLSPYQLKDENGRILENIWQFSKWYPRVPARIIPFNRGQKNSKIIWSHPAEIHRENDGPNEAYWGWREKGMGNPYAVRYPAGFHERHTCIGAWWPSEGDPDVYELLDYVEARKKIYCGEYARLHRNNKDFLRMKKMLEEGQNLQIVEVDGPDPGLEINERVIKKLLGDTRRPFGHGYVIAALLLGGEDWLR